MATYDNSPYGAYAAMPASQRPAPFQVTGVQSPFGSQDPFGQRNQFIQQLNDQRMQTAMNFNQGGQSPPSSWGQSPFGGVNQAYQQYAQQTAQQAPTRPVNDMYVPQASQTYAPSTQYMPNAYGSNVPSSGGYSPYTNAQGQGFAGTMSFAPGTPVEYQNQAYGQFAGSQGYYPGSARPVPPPPQGTPYNPGLAPPSEEPGKRPASPSLTAAQYKQLKESESRLASGNYRPPQAKQVPAGQVVDPVTGIMRSQSQMARVNQMRSAPPARSQPAPMLTKPWTLENDRAYRASAARQALDPVGALRAAGFRI